MAERTRPRPARPAKVRLRSDGDPAAATRTLRLLAQALARDPEDDDVRFQLAAAQAGDTAVGSAATGALCESFAALFARDLLRQSTAFLREPRLAAFRATPAGEALRAHAAALLPLWREAAAAGVAVHLLPPSHTHGRRSGQGNAGGAREGHADGPEPPAAGLVRAGVYLHETSRFLALDAGVDGATAALIDGGAGVVAAVSLSMRNCGTEGCGAIDGAEVSVTQLAGGAHRPITWRPPAEEATALDLRLGQGDAWVQVHDCCCWKDCRSPWYRVRNDSASRPERPLVPEGARLLVSERGAALSTFAAGFGVDEGTLQVPGAPGVPLPAGHSAKGALHSVLAARQPAAAPLALVLSVVDGCFCSGAGGARLDHLLTRVDLRSGAASLLVEGGGDAAMRGDASGAVYLQVKGTVRRFASVAAVGREPPVLLPSSVLLVPPRRPLAGCCGSSR